MWLVGQGWPASTHTATGIGLPKPRCDKIHRGYIGELKCLAQLPPMIASEKGMLSSLTIRRSLYHSSIGRRKNLVQGDTKGGAAPEGARLPPQEREDTLLLGTGCSDQHLLRGNCASPGVNGGQRRILCPAYGAPVPMRLHDGCSLAIT